MNCQRNGVQLPHSVSGEGGRIRGDIMLCFTVVSAYQKSEAGRIGRNSTGGINVENGIVVKYEHAFVDQSVSAG